MDFKILYLLKFDTMLFAIFCYRLAERMLAGILQCVGSFEKLCLVSYGNNISYYGHTACNGSGLIKNDYLRFTGLLERSGCLKEDTVLSGNAVSNHDRNRRRKA